MVPDGTEASVFGTLHEGVGAVLVGVAPDFELLGDHIGRVEAGSCGPAAVSGEECLSVDPVPGTVVDPGIQFLGRVVQGCQEGFPVSEVLLPVYLVHLVGGLAVKFQHFLTVVGDTGKVGSRYGHLCIILNETPYVCAFLCAGNGKEGEDHKCACQSFHIRNKNFTKIMDKTIRLS